MHFWHRAVLLCGLILPLHATDLAPAFPKAFAGQAEFETTAGVKEAGWASLVQAGQGSDAYLLSVRYLLGPGGGFPHQVMAADVASFVRTVKVDSFSGGVNSYVVEGLPISSSDVDSFKNPSDNLTIFRLHNVSSNQPDVLLAAHLPGAGETVWILIKGSGNDLSLTAATVVSTAANGWLSVKLKSGTLDKGSSGAPVLNGAGELVGVFSHRDKQNASLFDLVPATVISKTVSPGLVSK